jgi:rhodanese-related sulfurtransferase
MHIHELNPKKTGITLVLFAVVIVVGLLTVSSPRLKYAQAIDQTIEMVVWEEGSVFPYEILDVIDGSVDTVLLLDIRNTFKYGRGHIPGAENINSIDLLKEENIERFEQLKADGMAVVVYADNQLDANGPWMVLRQLGYDNVKILLGGYNYYKEWETNLGDSYADDAYFLGAAKHDFAEVASNVNAAESEDGEAKAKVTFTRKKKTAVAEGGC